MIFRPFLITPKIGKKMKMKNKEADQNDRRKRHKEVVGSTCTVLNQC